MQNAPIQNTAADFDPQQIVDAVKSRITPADWLIVNARRRPLVMQLLRNGMYALGSCVASLVFLLLWLYTISHWLSGELVIIYGMLALSVGFLGGAVFAFALTAQVWMCVRLLMVARELSIAVTPNGIVEYRGPKLGIHFAAPFAQVISIAHSNKQATQSAWAWADPRFQGVALTFWQRHPMNPNRRLARTWDINPCYQQPDSLAQIIILSQRAYHSSHKQWSAMSSPAPIARPRQVLNTMSRSWGWLSIGCVAFVCAVGFALFVIPYVTDPRNPYRTGYTWIAVGLVSVCALLAMISWLLAWRDNDWKRDIYD